MESKDIIDLILEKIENKSYVNISDFLLKNDLNDIKVKDLIKEIEEKHNDQLILNSKNTEVYSFDLVYNYFKLKLFRSLETGRDFDLGSDDFKVFKSDDLIRIYSIIDSEFFDYLKDYLNSGIKK
jgi:hypothetical protein